MSYRIHKEGITIECDNVDEIDLLLERILGTIKSGSSHPAPAAKQGRTKKSTELTGVSETKPTQGVCERPGCEKKVNSNNKGCDSCGRKVCSKCKNFSTGLCPECSARPT